MAAGYASEGPPLAEEVVEELDALEAIFGDEAFVRTGANAIRLCISPDPDDEGHVFGVASLEVEFLAGYPVEALPQLKVSSVSRLSNEACQSIQELADQTATENVGSASVFTIAEVIREWLQENTRTTPTPPPSPQQVSAKPLADDFDIDSEDLDDEMIKALQEVLSGDGQRSQELRKIKRLEGKEQRSALRLLLRGMTESQRDALVGTSSESEDDRKAKSAPKAVVKLPPTAIECAAGHALTAYVGRPPDYRNFDDGDYTCDVCGLDGKYKQGVYHCTKCFANGGKQFDACPSCGNQTDERAKRLLQAQNGQGRNKKKDTRQSGKKK